MALADYLPSRDTLKYDLQILGAVLVGLTSHYNEFPMLTPAIQQWLSLASLIYTIGAAAARPTRS